MPYGNFYVGRGGFFSKKMGGGGVHRINNVPYVAGSLTNQYISGSGVGASSIANRRAKINRATLCCLPQISYDNYNPFSVIFLLENTVYTYDAYVVDTLNYYWNTYPVEFRRYLIIPSDVNINTGASITSNAEIIANNIAILNKFYNLGCRLFVGFSRSTILTGVLSWFNNHPDARGISLSSSSPTLDIPKLVYRLQPSDQTIVDSLASQLTSAAHIYYLYTNPEVASSALLSYLNLTYPGKVIPYPVSSDADLTFSLISTYFAGSSASDVSIMYLFNDTQQQQYLNLFTTINPLPVTTYDIAISGIPLLPHPDAVLNYNYMSYQSLSTSLLFRNGLNALGNSFANAVPNCLLMINKCSYIEGVSPLVNINTISSHNSVLQFNANKDLLYYSILNQGYVYNGSTYVFKNKFMYFNDPIIGIYTLNLI